MEPASPAHTPWLSAQPCSVTWAQCMPARRVGPRAGPLDEGTARTASGASDAVLADVRVAEDVAGGAAPGVGRCRGHLDRRKVHLEARSAARTRFDPRSPTVHPAEAVDEREPDAGARHADVGT